MTALPEPPILIVTDRGQCSEPLETRAIALLRGGCRWLSLREKDMAPAARLALLERLVAIAGDFEATIGIHDDLKAAQTCRSALHLPADADIAATRRLLGNHRLLGKSCHNRDDIAAAASAGADYASLSPIFLSASKPGYRPILNLAALAAITTRSTLPILALGGVGAATLPKLAASGVKGVAIMGEAMTTSNPASWFRDIAEHWAELRPMSG